MTAAQTPERFAGSPAGPGLHDVMVSVAAALGVPGFDDRLGLPGAPRYVVVLVDGLGADLLREHADAAPFLAALAGIPGVRSGIPSTTATSLTSLGTGLQAGQHGVVGYTSREPASGRRINALSWADDVDPLQWQPHTTVLERMVATGMAASVVNDAAFESSGLTLCSQRGVPFHGIGSVWERQDVVLDVVEETTRGLVYAYESRLDHTGHRYGCTSGQWRDMLTTIDHDLARLRAELPVDTVLLVTSDHGMVDLPDEGRFDMESVPSLRDDVTLIAGEARFRHVYTRSGAEQDVAGHWAEVLGERAVVRTQEGLEDWLGPIDERVRPRIGDVVVAALGDFAVFSSMDFAIEFKMAGFHGSITDAERNIPVLVAH
ncbi:alkaline phosphatase family protein [Aeromicrobium sp. CTD01-1L150]|uniref:alkaline phosphatase family protein n=1 Tax=Aeromicrobium sp. CTD01-1L150 TaxID=3341830 RepID=UPI0035C1A0D3